MLIRAKMSLLGLYKFDSTLFDDMALPDQVDPDILRDYILLNVGRMGCIYPDPDFMKSAIEMWSRARVDSWQHMADALDLEYEVLYNKDAYYTESASRERESEQSTTGSTTSTGTATDTNTESVKGFNSDSWSEHTKNDGSGTSTGSTSSRGSGSENENETITRTRREYGNIGVTMAQQLIEAEMRLRAEFNIYDIISDEFKSEFCLMVY